MKYGLIFFLVAHTFTQGFSQECFFLKNCDVFRDTSYKLELGNKENSISVSTSSYDSVFSVFKCSVLFVSQLDEIYSVSLKTNDNHFIFLTNLKSIVVKRGEPLKTGTFIGSVFYDSHYKMYILEISVRKGDVELDNENIIRYLVRKTLPENSSINK